MSLLARTLQNVEDMSFETLSVGVPWADFETFPQYLDAIERRGVGLNFGCYVGHTAVRLYVMGDEAYERRRHRRRATADAEVIAAAMDGGAIGFASSASPTHNGDGGRPVPSRVADLAELTALLEPLREADRGVVALLPGGVISFDEVFDLQARIQRPFTWTALLTVKGLPVSREADRASRPGPRSRYRSVAADLRPATRVPDEPAATVHHEHPRRASPG